MVWAPCTICSRRVPFVVVSTRLFPSTNLLGYSSGEFPCCRPGAILPSLSPAVMLLGVAAPIATHSSTALRVSPEPLPGAALRYCRRGTEDVYDDGNGICRLIKMQ
jgi:hypothetical protein